MSKFYEKFPGTKEFLQTAYSKKLYVQKLVEEFPGLLRLEGKYSIARAHGSGAAAESDPFNWRRSCLDDGVVQDDGPVTITPQSVPVDHHHNTITPQSDTGDSVTAVDSVTQALEHLSLVLSLENREQELVEIEDSDSDYDEYDYDYDDDYGYYDERWH
jgi:hypothetical protein